MTLAPIWSSKWATLVSGPCMWQLQSVSCGWSNSWCSWGWRLMQWLMWAAVQHNWPGVLGTWRWRDFCRPRGPRKRTARCQAPRKPPKVRKREKLTGKTRPKLPKAWKRLGRRGLSHHPKRRSPKLSLLPKKERRWFPRKERYSVFLGFRDSHANNAGVALRYFKDSAGRWEKILQTIRQCLELKKWRGMIWRGTKPLFFPVPIHSMAQRKCVNQTINIFFGHPTTRCIWWVVPLWKPEAGSTLKTPKRLGRRRSQHLQGFVKRIGETTDHFVAKNRRFPVYFPYKNHGDSGAKNRPILQHPAGIGFIHPGHVRRCSWRLMGEDPCPVEHWLNHVKPPKNWVFSDG